MSPALKVFIGILAFAGIFLAGAVTGGVAMAIISKGHMMQVQHERQLEQVQHQMERQERQMEKQQSAQLVQVLRQQLQQQQQLLEQRPQLEAQLMQQGQRRLPAPEQFGPQLMRRFTNQIRPPLTPDERATIGPLVNQTAEDLRRLRRDTTNKTEEMLEHLQDQISAVLTPAQRDRFGDMIQHWRDAFQKYNAEQQQRQAEQRLLEQRRQKMQQLAPGGSPPAPAPASATPPAAAPAPSPAPAG